MGPAPPPRVTVLIATRDRPSDLARCLESVLACDHDSFEVVVVDQSEPKATVPDDDRVVHLPTDSRGKSAALNLGVGVARGDLMAFTDDDCTVPPSWLRDIEALYARHPEVAMSFGEVRVIPHDPREAFVPCVDLDRFALVDDPRRAHIRGGAGCNMAARRQTFDAIGPYDEQIGPGSRFHACEEYDVYYRVMASGRTVAFAPELSLLHWGKRPYSDGSGQMLKRRYAYGEGAVIGKHLRLGDRRMVLVAARITAEDLRVLGGNLRRHHIAGLGQMVYKWGGLVRALTTRVDRGLRVFAE